MRQTNKMKKKKKIHWLFKRKHIDIMKIGKEISLFVCLSSFSLSLRLLSQMNLNKHCNCPPAHWAVSHLGDTRLAVPSMATRHNAKHLFHGIKTNMALQCGGSGSHRGGGLTTASAAVPDHLRP